MSKEEIEKVIDKLVEQDEVEPGVGDLDDEGLEWEIDRFKEIMEEIDKLATEARDLIPRGMPRRRAESYWYPHILTAIEKDRGGYMGGTMTTMADTLRELQEEGEEEGE